MPDPSPDTRPEPADAYEPPRAEDVDTSHAPAEAVPGQGSVPRGVA